MASQKLLRFGTTDESVRHGLYNESHCLIKGDFLEEFEENRGRRLSGGDGFQGGEEFLLFVLGDGSEV
jgi:hypothetical protein